jgi:hypothetical protein
MFIKRKAKNLLIINILLLAACSPETGLSDNNAPEAPVNRQVAAPDLAKPAKIVKTVPQEDPKPEENLVIDPDSVPEIKEVKKDSNENLKVDTSLIKYGIETGNSFSERTTKKFHPGENIIIISPVSGLKVTNNIVTYNENIIIRKDNKEIYNKENIFGNNGNILESGSDSATVSVQLRTNMTLPDTFKGDLLIIIKITDWNDKSKTAGFDGGISLE